MQAGIDAPIGKNLEKMERSMPLNPKRTAGIYSELEKQTPLERETRIWNSLQELLAAAWQGSEEFRARLELAGLSPDRIQSLEDWPAIPVFRKKDLISFQAEQGLQGLVSCDLGRLRRIFMSPGPIFDPEGAGPDYWGWTEAFYACGFRPGDLVQMTFSYHLTPAGLMLEEPLREIGCAVIPAGPGNTAVQLELLTKLPVTGFVGMASYLKVIKDKAVEQGLDIRKDLSLEVAFVAAERLSQTLREELERELGMTIRQGYGTADVGCMAYECQNLTGMHLSSRCHVEICDPKTGVPVAPGEVGEVVVSPFTTEYPLVRLATGDLSRLVEAPCPCGRSSARLAGILGRVDDTAKVKGQFIYPHQVAEVVAKYPQILRWQVVVTNPKGLDSLGVRLLARGDFPQEEFAKSFQDRLKLRPKIEIIAEESELPENSRALVDERTFD